ncbi:MAG TPA: hypothetical protein VGK73_11490 [Polyangiaceae bacterium]
MATRARSTKVVMLLLSGSGLAVACFALVQYLTPDGSSSEPPGEARAAPNRSPAPSELGRSDTEGTVAELLEDGSARAWGRIAQLYPGARERTQRAVLEGIQRVPELERAIAYVLATVGEDPKPPSADPMIDEAAEALLGRWKTSADVDYARRTMMMQRTDKRRWVLARALLVHFERTGEKSPFFSLKAELEAKLIDLHATAGDPFVKNGLIDGVRALGGKDAALILTKGLAVRDDELEALNEQRAAVEGALEPEHAR